jgi:hypothetical protein
MTEGKRKEARDNVSKASELAPVKGPGCQRRQTRWLGAIVTRAGASGFDRGGRSDITRAGYVLLGLDTHQVFKQARILFLDLFPDPERDGLACVMGISLHDG